MEISMRLFRFTILFILLLATHTALAKMRGQ
jgi:hypothetical protein